MATAPNPLLTICVPTMDRPGLLEAGLLNLVAEAGPQGGAVEILVTDNGRPLPGEDPGRRPLEDLIRSVDPAIRYVRVPGAPVVFARSFLFGPTLHARGDYVWVVGDDDMVIRGAVAQILGFLRENPDLDYVYLNHGWISVEQRNLRNRNDGATMPPDYRGYHSDDMTARRLARMEDIVGLAAVNPYASFSTIFCYVARRRIYIEHAGVLDFTDDVDECRFNFSAIFPHTHLTMAVLAGRPVGYIGEPCVAQGSTTADDRAWVYHSMIHGHLRLFEWLGEHTAFDPGTLTRLSSALAEMAGRLMARIRTRPGDHLGVDNLERYAVPRLSAFPEYGAGFERESRNLAGLEDEARLLAAEWERWSSSQAPVRAAVWDSMRRGVRLLELAPALAESVAVAVSLCAWQPWPHKPGLQPPGVLEKLRPDVLVLAVPRETVPAFLDRAAALLGEITPVITVAGIYRAGRGSWAPA